MKKLMLLLFLMLLFAGCQKKTLEYANTPKPADQPEYTIQADRDGRGS